MADTSSYTTEKTALILEQVENKVTSSLIRARPFFDILQRRRDSQLGGGPFYKLPSTQEVTLNSTGGSKFTIPVRLDALSVTVRMTTEAQQLDPQQKDQVVRAEYDVITVATPMALFDTRINMAQGDEAVVDYVTETSVAAIEDHLNTLAGTSYLWSSTSAGGWTGLNHAINTTTTSGVFGGLDRAVHTNWTNHTLTTTNYRTSREGILELGQLLAKIQGYGGKTGLHITEYQTFGWFAAEQYGQLAISQVTDDVWAGYPVVAGAPVLLDPNLSSTYWYGIDLAAQDVMVLRYKRFGNKPAFALVTPSHALERQLGTTFAVVTQGNQVWRKLNTSFVQVVSAV